jgi:carbonic anhydrase
VNPIEIVYRYGGEAAARERPANAADAHRRLDEGNRTFAGLFTAGMDGCPRCVIDVDSSNVGVAPGGPAAASQRPFAAVLGCADARVPIELIFNEGPNDLFVVRVAGNTLGNEVQGSLDYALDHLGESMKLIAVLGHSGCGAVTAAVDVLLNPRGYLSLASKHAVRSVVDRLHVVVHAADRMMKATLGPDVVRHPQFREALIEAAIATNAALSAHTLQQEIDLGGPPGMQVVYGVYVLEDRSVWAPRGGSDEVAGLAHPPRGEQGFADFGAALLRSRRIAALVSK